MANTYKDLEVWKKSMDLVTEIHLITKEFPKEELYGLTNQIRRAAVSVPSNIAEGAARESNKEYLRFLYIARGSLAELDTQWMITKSIGYVNAKKYTRIEETIKEIGKMLNGLINYRKKKNPNL